MDEQAFANEKVKALVEALKTAADYVDDAANGGLVSIGVKGAVTTITTHIEVATEDQTRIRAALAAMEKENDNN